MHQLSEAAPPDPLVIVRAWLSDAVNSGLRNPDALALATVGTHSRPSVRMVLMRGLSVADGYAVFYTHYRSRKAHEINRHPMAAGVLYWETLGRQIRVEGPVLRSPTAESDTYFAARPRRSQLNAWVSEQSSALAPHQDLEHQAQLKAQEFGSDPVPRPPYWGGYRLWFSAIELWVEGSDRFHDRIRYERQLEPCDEHSFVGGPWHSQRLQP